MQRHLPVLGTLKARSIFPSFAVINQAGIEAMPCNTQLSAQGPFQVQDHRHECDLDYVSEQPTKILRAHIQRSLCMLALPRRLGRWASSGTRLGNAHGHGLQTWRRVHRYPYIRQWRGHHIKLLIVCSAGHLTSRSCLVGTGN